MKPTDLTPIQRETLGVCLHAGGEDFRPDRKQRAAVRALHSMDTPLLGERFQVASGATYSLTTAGRAAILAPLSDEDRVRMSTVYPGGKVLGAKALGPSGKPRRMHGPAEWSECAEHPGEYEAHKWVAVVEPGEDPVTAFENSSAEVVTDCRRCIEEAEREERRMLGW